MSDHNYCIILAGGVGARFWPLSRESRPKQFIKTHDDSDSFVQRAYKRAVKLFDPDRIYIVTLSRYRELLREQLPLVDDAHIILEPYGRNTAPAILHSAYVLLKKDLDAIMSIFPADHAIGKELIFIKTVQKAQEYVREHDVLLTLGIVPERPDTNFGYVQVSGGTYGGDPVKAKTFTEKPGKELAQVFIDSGEFLWNSGIFFWKAGLIVSEMEKLCPEIAMLWRGWEKKRTPQSFVRFVERAYTESPKISIDYAVLEKSDKVWVLPSKFGWDDLGSFEAFSDYVYRATRTRKVHSLAGPSILKDLEGDILYNSDPHKLVVINGLKDYLVINTDDVLLICPKDDATLQSTISELSTPKLKGFK